MNKYHLLYTLKTGEFCDTIKEFPSFADAETWLEGEGAVYWEIGLSEEEIKVVLCKEYKNKLEFLQAGPAGKKISVY